MDGPVTFKDSKYDLLAFRNRIEHPHWMLHRFLRNQHFVCFCVNTQQFHKIQEIAQNADVVRSDEAFYEDVRYGFGMLKGPTFSP